MPTNRYANRRLVHVVPFTGSTIKYGFQTNVDADVSTALGHTAVAGAYPSGLVIGANAPKPARASRILATGSESSFISAANIAAARTAGWTVGKSRVRVGGSTARSKLVYITFEGNKLAWRMPTGTYTRLSAEERTALGIVDGTADALDLVFGVSYPELPRVGKRSVGTDGADLVSTFCDPASLDDLPAGFTSLKASRSTV